VRARFPNLDPADPQSFSGYIRAAGALTDEISDPMPDPNGDGRSHDAVFADPLFQDPQNKDYRLRPQSPALSLGFVSFDAREARLTAAFANPWIDADRKGER
jgi:hypothetical protein